MKWSPDTQTIETVTLERKYLCFCYDHQENCYWAVPECEPYLICRLDACFCEVGNITIKGAYQQRPVSLCCDACGKGLWICYPCQLAYLEKHSEKVTWDTNEDNRRINLGLMVQGECRAICYYEGSRQILELSSQCEAETLEICVPKAHKFVGVAPCSCKHGCKECRFYVLLSPPKARAALPTLPVR